MSNQKFDLLGRIVALLATISQAWGVLADLCEKLSSPAREEWQAELARFLRKEPTWVRRWREENGMIYFTVVSNGRTGQQWIDYFEENGIRIGEYAKSLLLSPDFKSTTGIKYEIAVLKGELFDNDNRVTSRIRTEAGTRKLAKPEAEVACLIREMFSDDEEIKAMGLSWIITMHEPIKDSDGNLNLLGADRRGDGSWLRAYCGKPDGCWGRDDGFAFVSQVSS